MLKILHFSLCLILFSGVSASAWSQCVTSSTIPVLSNGDTISGVFNLTGNFSLPVGDTIYVRPYANGGCGRLEINTTGNINIQGAIIGSQSGFFGGSGGLAGGANNIQFITSCPSPTDQCGSVFTYGGVSGGNSNPGGGGSGGADGVDGSGRKNQCLTFGDEGGRVGGSGGAGGGAGGSYAGTGTNALPGGVGTVPTISNASVTTCNNNPISAGTGGNPGNTGILYGTASGFDIDLGSGGGGAGGGGRGRTAGQAGQTGGAGGGLIKLVANGDLTFTGLIAVDGGNGGNGGDGGDSGDSPRCCVDACPGADEYTHTGAGGGGAGAGGGSGGGVYLQTMGVAVVTGNITARGGNGGQAGQGGAAIGPIAYNCFLGNSSMTCGAATAGGLGGAGGGGRIKLFYNGCAPGNNIALSSDLSGGNGAGGFGATGTVYTGTDGAFVPGAAMPAMQTVCYNGDPGNLNSLPSTGGFGAITYQWQSQTACVGPWANIAGASTLNYDPPAGIQDTTCYRLLISSGTCNLISDTLQVNVIPALPAAISPSGIVNLCLGDSDTLTSSGGTGASYQWSYNGGNVVGATDSFLVVTSSGDYAVEISYPVGCNAVSLPVTMNFQAPPAAFAVALGDTILCPGDSVNLSGLGGGSYQWFLNGNSLLNDTLQTLFVNQAGFFSVEVLSGAGCSSHSDSVEIVQANAPVAGLLAQGNTSFCDGDSVGLLASGGGSYAWFLDGAPLSNANGANVFAFANGDYQVVVTNTNGCLDSSSILAVNVDPTPDAQMSPAGIPVSCQGDSVLLLAAGGGSYAWLYNGVLTGDTNAFLQTDLPGNYTVVVSSPLGCVDTSVTHAYAWFPPVSVAINGPVSPYVCPGQSIDLLGQFSGPSVAFQWFQNDSSLAGETNPNLNTDSVGIYHVQAYDANGCIYESETFVVLPGESPVASIALLGQNPFCPADSLWLQADVAGAYEWLLDGQSLGLTDSVILAENGGNYGLAVQTGCGTDTAWLDVVASPGPLAGFLYNNLPANEVEFIDQSLHGALWFWDFGNGATSTDQNPMHVFPAGGTYPVTMITWDINGCSDTISLQVNVIDPGLFVSNVFTPNQDGVNDVAWTRFDALDNFEFRIYDRWGKLVFLTQNLNEYWDGKINGNSAPVGVYFYQLVGENDQGEEIDEKGNLHLLR